MEMIAALAGLKPKEMQFFCALCDSADVAEDKNGRLMVPTMRGVEHHSRKTPRPPCSIAHSLECGALRDDELTDHPAPLHRSRAHAGSSTAAARRDALPDDRVTRNGN